MSSLNSSVFIRVRHPFFVVVRQASALRVPIVNVSSICKQRVRSHNQFEVPVAVRRHYVANAQRLTMSKHRFRAPSHIIVPVTFSSAPRQESKLPNFKQRPQRGYEDSKPGSRVYRYTKQNAEPSSARRGTSIKNGCGGGPKTKKKRNPSRCCTVHPKKGKGVYFRYSLLLSLTTKRSTLGLGQAPPFLFLPLPPKTRMRSIARLRGNSYNTVPTSTGPIRHLSRADTREPAGN